MYSIFILNSDSTELENINAILSKRMQLPIRTFTSADDMLNNVTEDHPTILILDLHIENTSRTIAIMRKKNETALIIGLCTDDKDEKMMEAMTAGANNFIQKQYVSQLPSIINNHLKVRESLLENKQQ